MTKKAQNCATIKVASGSNNSVGKRGGLRVGSNGIEFSKVVSHRLFERRNELRGIDRCEVREPKRAAPIIEQR